MTVRHREHTVRTVVASGLPPTCRVTGCSARAAAEGLCEDHVAEQSRRRRAALVGGSLGRTLVAHDPDPSWRARAACRGLDPAMFFPEVGENTAAAKAVCAQCPVSRECLDFALANTETEGVWGGTTPRARRPLRRALLREAS